MNRYKAKPGDRVTTTLCFDQTPGTVVRQTKRGMWMVLRDGETQTRSVAEWNLKLVTAKPCPFCGSDYVQHESVSQARYLRCRFCSATAGHVFAHEDVPQTWEMVVERWNRRG